MKVSYTIGDREYVPLRAVPHLSSGVLSARVITNMIRDPEGFVDSHHDQVVVPLKYAGHGQLCAVPPSSFIALARARGRVDLQQEAAALPAGIVVDRKAVQEKYELMINEVLPKHGLPWLSGLPSWNDDPVLSKDQLATVFAGLPPIRSNAAANVQCSILGALEAVERKCLAKKITLNRNALPGRKADWQELLAQHGGPAHLAQDTFNDHFKAVGLRCRQGSDRAGWNAVLQAVQGVSQSTGSVGVVSKSK